MKKKRVVIPANMGRGIKANTEKSQYEVDLTDYVDGSTVTYTGGKLGVNVPTSITSVSTAGAIEGDGSVTNPVKLNFNDSIVKGTDGKYGVAVTGLTCASIDDLPEKPWKKGTTILAKQDGACVRLAALDSIFQEIGVGITADKTNSFINEEYNVVVTVSNTGESTNELTNLNIVGPEITTNYTVKNVKVGNSGADEVERVDDFTYNIKGLRKGGYVTVKFTVVPNTLGTYQFTAAVNPNSALDKDLGNNSATVILSASTKSDPTFVPSVDCPLIEAVDVKTNNQFVALPLVNFGKEYKVPSVGTYYLGYSNVLSDRTTLQGMAIKFNTECTILARRYDANNADHQNRNNNVVIGDNGDIFFSGSDDITPEKGNQGLIHENMSPDSTEPVKPRNVFDVDVATSDNKTFTINSSATALFIAVRPRGKNCRWQFFSFVAKHSNPTRKEISVTNERNLTYTHQLLHEFSDSDHAKSTDIVSGKIIKLTSSNNGVIRKTIVTVQAGNEASADITVPAGLSVVSTSGLVTISSTRIAVSADAKSTDSIRSTYLDVIIEE
jgi:hypothetical protein|nr:MAG TPA: hypothetical protein [Caudoviricetes sp.]